MRRVRAGGMEGSVPSRGRSFLLKPGTQAPGFNRGDFPPLSCQNKDLWLSCTRASVGFWSFWGNRVFYRCGSLQILAPGLKYPLFLFFLELPQLFLREFFFMQKKRPSRGRASFLLQGFAYSAIMLPSAHSRNCPGAGWDENCTGVST